MLACALTAGMAAALDACAEPRRDRGDSVPSARERPAPTAARNDPKLASAGAPVAADAGALFAAIERSGAADPNAVARALAAGSAVEQRDSMGCTPLMRAAGRDDGAALLELLLVAGADVAKRDPRDRTALVFAAQHGVLANVELLAKAAPLARQDPGMALAAAAQLLQVGPRYRAVVDFLLARGAPVDGVSPGGGTALVAAAKHGELAVLQRLLARGARVNTHAVRGTTALHQAVSAGAREVVVRLLRAKADVNARDDAGRTPLQLAVQANPPELAFLLLDAGADVRGRDPDSKTLLHSVRPDEHGNTMPSIQPTFESYRWGRKRARPPTPRQRLVRRLIRAGLSPELADKEGSRPLHLAAAENDESWIAGLLAGGAQIDARDAHGATPLLRAAQRCQARAIYQLIDAGADVRAVNAAGKGALELLPPKRSNAAVPEGFIERPWASLLCALHDEIVAALRDQTGR
jgi:ankyrin repeat protein